MSFSGDANQHQDILRWELENTPLAANALHNTWSHDIGGFMCQSLNQTRARASAGRAPRIVAHFRGFLAASGEAAPSAVMIDKVAVPAGAPGCAAPGCWWVVEEAAHSMLCPAGTLVVDSGGAKSVSASAQFVVQF